jgi:dTDP-glucose pyrophosphorylase
MKGILLSGGHGRGCFRVTASISKQLLRLDKDDLTRWPI